MISTIIIAKNEEKNIERALKSVSWCDEILVIDDDSTDKTEIIAKNNGAKIIQKSLENNFSKARNFALMQAEHEWVLFLDADEEVSKSLAFEIQNSLKTSLIDAYEITRLDYLWGRQLKYGDARAVLLRLARKNTGVWKGAVHENWVINGKIGKLKNPLIHYPHPSVAEFLQDINTYTSIRAMELYNQGIKASFLSVLFHMKTKFYQNYIFRGGFRDGLPGLIHAMIMSFHAFLVRGKLWLLWQKKSHV